MTKKVRIENADTSNHKLVVQAWATSPSGASDALIGERELNNPADLAEFYVHQGQYLVVKEQVPSNG